MLAMTQDWWKFIVHLIVEGIVMSAVVGWLMKSRMKPRTMSDSQWLVHPPSTLVLGLAIFLFFAGVAVLSNVYANKTTTWWTTAIFVGFTLLSLPIIADYFFARHRMSSEGLDYGRMTGSRGYMRWADLRRVHYSPMMKWFRLESQTGEVARISALHMGLPDFARLLLAYAPHGAIEPDTLPILNAAAAGNPPSV